MGIFSGLQCIGESKGTLLIGFFFLCVCVCGGGGGGGGEFLWNFGNQNLFVFFYLWVFLASC